MLVPVIHRASTTPTIVVGPWPFAVIATTIVLVSVFVPIAFLEGDVGRLFSEFAITMAAAVAFSSFVALSLSPMLASKVLHPPGEDNWFTGRMCGLRLHDFNCGLKAYRREVTESIEVYG